MKKTRLAIFLTLAVFTSVTHDVKGQQVLIPDGPFVEPQLDVKHRAEVFSFPFVEPGSGESKEKAIFPFVQPGSKIESGSKVYKFPFAKPDLKVDMTNALYQMGPKDIVPNGFLNMRQGQNRAPLFNFTPLKSK